MGGPGEFIPGVDKGIREQMKAGVAGRLSGNGSGVRLHFGSYHDVDSSELAFKIAASMAFKAGFMKANPASSLLEADRRRSKSRPGRLHGRRDR